MKKYLTLRLLMVFHFFALIILFTLKQYAGMILFVINFYFILILQEKYKEQLKDVKMVIMLASTLHAIGVGNMLPSTVKLVCLDINPASVTKLLDRGSTQAAGLVSDIGTFLPLLAQEIKKIQKPKNTTSISKRN